MNQQIPRRRYKLTLYEGRTEANRQKLEDELDAFWTKGVKILDVESRGRYNGQVYTIEADRGFNKVWRNENQLPIKNSVRRSEKEDLDDGTA